MMRDLVVLGTAGHARSCLDVLAATGWTVVGCVGSRPVQPLQARYLGSDDVLEDLLVDGVTNAVIAIGDNKMRRRLMTDVIGLGFSLPSVVSTNAVISATAVIGPGCVLLHGAIVGPYTTIGTGVIVNTAATIDHDCKIGDFVHSAPGVHIAGDVTLESGVFLGVGASVIPGVRIGEWATLGAGAAVIRDVESYKRLVGVPARELPAAQ